MEQLGLEKWRDKLDFKLKNLVAKQPIEYSTLLTSLPKIIANTRITLNQPLIKIEAIPLSPLITFSKIQRQALRKQLFFLSPWYMGYYSIYGVKIKSEWRSDWQWENLAKAIQSLKNKLVLDIHCGNGYYCWRIAGQGAKLVIGLQPNPLFRTQFLAVQHFISKQTPVVVLPLKIEQLPKKNIYFDSIFSLGLLSQYRSPMKHLTHLYNLLASNGELVLETLVIEGDKEQQLTPQGFYAGMSNVYYIPSILKLINDLKKSGFQQIECISTCTLSANDQYSPKRAIFLAHK